MTLHEILLSAIREHWSTPHQNFDSRFSGKVKACTCGFLLRQDFSDLMATDAGRNLVAGRDVV